MPGIVNSGIKVYGREGVAQSRIDSTLQNRKFRAHVADFNQQRMNLHTAHCSQPRLCLKTAVNPTHTTPFGTNSSSFGPDDVGMNSASPHIRYMRKGATRLSTTLMND